MDVEIMPSEPATADLRKKRKWDPPNGLPSKPVFNVVPPSKIHRNISLAVGNGTNDTEASHKRARLSSHVATSTTPQGDDPASAQMMNLSRLPVEVLQHIFSFVQPVSLGRLIRVNRLFNTLLDPRKSPTHGCDPPLGCLSLRDTDSVWSDSRKKHFPGLPRPLDSMKELEMWQLIRGDACQYCGKKSTSILPPSRLSPWNAGPGTDNVRRIWPFGIRSCGSCLSSRLIREVDLILTLASLLTPGLPFAIFTSSLNFVAATAIRQTQVPSNLQLVKHYFQPQIDVIQQEFEDAKLLGIAATQEWLKGLEDTGNTKKAAAARWEQWEMAGGFEPLPGFQKPRPQPARIHTVSPLDVVNPALPTQQLPYHPGGVGSPTNGQFHTPLAPPPLSAPGIFPHLPPKPITPAPGTYPVNFQQRSTASTPVPAHPAQQRPERNLHDVVQMKADRRAEIERRCLLLSPPIMPSTLVYMDAFTAAIQIPMVLNESAWDLLKGRLLARRHEAEQKEEEQRAVNHHLQLHVDDRRRAQDQLDLAREMARERGEVQKPARERINEFADDIIQTQWRGGATVTRDNAMQFAADVLMWVRKRFSEELAREDSALASQGLSIPRESDPEASNRRLTLDHMKAVFEAKIRPLTDRFRRELFFCNDCEGTSKHFALDAVIQHYAAKHTSELSLGTATVHWKKEWPEQPPFDPFPLTKASRMSADYSGHETSPSRFGGAHSMSGMELLHRGLIHGDARITDLNGPRNGLPNYSPRTAPGYVPAGNMYDDRRNQFAPPFSPVMPPEGLTNHQFNGMPHNFAPTPMSAVRTSPRSESRLIQASTPGPGHSQFVPPGQPYNIYQVQLEDLARIAREVWDGTDGIRSLSDSLRIYVIIHHVVINFARSFTNEPTLTLFTDALNNSSQLKPLRSCDGLVCKACVIAAALSGPNEYQPTMSTLPNTAYVLPDLVKHFQTSHVETGRPHVIAHAGVDSQKADWKIDMLQLPDDNTIRSLIHAPGITFDKLSIIAAVLPAYFPSPLPEIEDVSADIPESNVLPSESAEPIGALRATMPTRNSELGLERSGDIEYSGTNLMELLSSEGRLRDPLVEDEGYDPHQPDRVYHVAARSYEEDPRYEPRHFQEFVVRAPHRQYEEERLQMRQPVYDEYRQRVDHYGDYYVRAPPPMQYFRVRDEVEERIDPPRVIPRHLEADIHDDRNGTYTPHRSLNADRDDAESAHAGQAAPLKPASSPHRESNTAAEQFLKNFDADATEDYPDEEAHAQSARRSTPGLEIIGPSEATLPIELDSGSASRHQARQSVQGDHRAPSQVNSPPSNGRHLTLESARDRSRSPIRSRRGAQEAEYETVRPEAGRHGSHHEQYALPRHNDSYLARDIHYAAEPPLRRERPLDMGGRGPVEVYYRNRRSPPPPTQRRVLYETPSPELARRRPYPDSRVEIIEAVHPRQYRNMDDLRYVDGGRSEAVEYIRVESREAQPAGRYYMEGGAAPAMPVRFEYDGRYRRDFVYEREPPPPSYMRAPPRDGYIPQARYQ